jgi:hypothetical protein
MSGKANNLTYSSGEKEGLVSIWKHGETYVLTWEECPAGEQYDESTYTRDERHVFAEISELLEFIKMHDLKLEIFTP